MSDDNKNQKNKPLACANESADCIDIPIPPLVRAVDIRVDLGSGQEAPIASRCQEKEKIPDEGIVLTRAGISYMTDVLASFISNLLTQHCDQEHASLGESDDSEGCSSSGSSLDENIEEIKRKIKDCTSEPCVFNRKHEVRKQRKDNRRSSRSEILGSICNNCMTLISDIAERLRADPMNDSSKTDSSYQEQARTAENRSRQVEEDDSRPETVESWSIGPSNKSNSHHPKEMCLKGKKHRKRLPTVIIKRRSK